MNQRIDQLNSLVQKEVADILRREIEFAPGVLVTVIRAFVADDAASARVWISVLPVDHGQAVLDTIKVHIRDIQKLLNKQLVMKIVPKLTFVLDTALAQGERTIGVLDQLGPDDLGDGDTPSA